MEHTFWIWYPGDFELYHAMKQNFSRVERGFGWPAFWKSEGFRNRVAFRRTYELEQEISFTVFSNAIGHVLVTWENGEKKYPFGKKITAGPGKVKVSIHAGCVEAFPCAYVQGEVIHSDKTWMAEDYSQPLVPVGVCKYFTKPEQKPTVWEYTEKECKPVKISEVNGGVLAEFETEKVFRRVPGELMKKHSDNNVKDIYSFGAVIYVAERTLLVGIQRYFENEPEQRKEVRTYKKKMIEALKAEEILLVDNSKANTKKKNGKRFYEIDYKRLKYFCQLQDAK